MKLRHKINKIMRGVKKAQKMGWTIKRGGFMDYHVKRCCPLLAYAVIARGKNPLKTTWHDQFSKFYGDDWKGFVCGVDNNAEIYNGSRPLAFLTGKYVWNLIEKEVKDERSNNISNSGI